MSKIINTYNPQDYNLALAEALKQIPELEKPEWIDYVKSGVFKERVPEDEDFWYKRIASVLRQLYLNGVVGVGRLRTKYGGRKNRGVLKDKFKKGSGKMIRVILQKAELAGLVEKVDKMQHGRRLTKKGREFLDAIKVKSSEGEI